MDIDIAMGFDKYHVSHCRRSSSVHIPIIPAWSTSSRRHPSSVIPAWSTSTVPDMNYVHNYTGLTAWLHMYICAYAQMAPFAEQSR